MLWSGSGPDCAGPLIFRKVFQLFSAITSHCTLTSERSFQSFPLMSPPHRVDPQTALDAAVRSGAEVHNLLPQRIR
jgi:hypothetical protein